MRVCAGGHRLQKIGMHLQVIGRSLEAAFLQYVVMHPQALGLSEDNATFFFGEEKDRVSMMGAARY